VFVYVVTSYVNPTQTERLVARLRRDSPSARIIVSHDRKTPTPDTAVLDALDAELWLTPEPVTWGDATYLRSLLAVIARADLAQDDWLTILTGQDYPLRPLREYEEHLAACGADMLLEEPDDDPNLPTFLRRYLSRSYRLPSWTDRHRIRQIMKHVPGVEMSRSPRGLPPYLSRRRLRTPFHDGFRLYKGCDQFAVSGRAARILLRADPKLLRYYSHTSTPSESYPHTVLRNDPSLHNFAGMIHYAQWVDSPHPKWLSEEDLDAMLDSRLWFARKFRPEDSVLDELDRRLDAPPR
jgi:hypothetical protein